MFQQALNNFLWINICIQILEFACVTSVNIFAEILVLPGLPLVANLTDESAADPSFFSSHLPTSFVNNALYFLELK